MRQGIFLDKSDGARLQGIVSKEGAEAFEKARGRLAKLVKWSVKSVSDGDTFEYLARGHNATVKYLKKYRKDL